MWNSPRRALRYPGRVSVQPLRVRRHESELGAWELVSREPQPRLRDFVAGYCGYVERGTRPLRRRELPSGDVVVILSFGPSILVSDPERGGAVARRTSFVAGLHGEHSVTEHDGAQHGLQLNLTPLGASAFLGAPAGEVAGRVVDLEDALGAEAPALLEQLHGLPTWEARFDGLEEHMAARLAGLRPSSPDVAWAWGRLTETQGRVTVAELAAELRCSRRHLAARFREQVGLPPKAAARILRFDRAARALRSGAHPSLAELARDCGYFDQSHFNRDFQAFSGWSPTELAARLLPDGGGLAGA